MAWQNFDTVGAMPGYGGGWFGGGAGGAFAGGLAGSVLGDLLWPNNRGRDGYGGGCDGYGGHGAGTVVQINDNDGERGNGRIGQWELMKEMSDTRREVAVMPYIAQNTALEQTIGLNSQLQALASQICQSTNASQRLELEGQYKAALQLCGVSQEMAECCCKQLQATTVMGFETQLRDQAQHCEILKELQEVKCLVKDVEKDGIIRAQTEKIAAMEGRLNTAEIIAAMKPVAPVPAYIQANPYENFLPAVRLAENRGCCDNRWSNCGGFQ